MGVNVLIFSGDSDLDHRRMSVGPYRIANELRKCGYTVQIVDVFPFDEFNQLHELVLKKFVDKDTLWIGFSVTYMNQLFKWPYVLSPDRLKYLREKDPNLDLEIKKFVSYSKGLNPKIEFVIGGTRIIDLSHLNFYNFKSYADKSIIEFTDSLCRGNIPIKKTYNYDVYDEFATSHTIYQKNDILDYYKSLSIEISRGCIFKCKFCAFPLNGKTKGEWIKRSNVLFEELVSNYENYGITNYFFSDDTFNDSPQKLEMLYEEVFSKLPFKITFSAYLRLDLLHRYPHTIQLLKDSGLTACFFGIETINPTAAKIIGKGMHPQKQIEFVQKLKTNEFKDIFVASGWIFGLPTDTKQSLSESTKWIFSNNNPMDKNYISTLGVKHPNSYRAFFSEFDMNAEKYGLSIYLDEQKETQWSHKETKLTSQWCNELVNLLRHLENESSKNKKNQAWLQGSYLNLGISEHDIRTLTYIEIDKKYNLEKTKQKMNSFYIKNLLNV